MALSLRCLHHRLCLTLISGRPLYQTFRSNAALEALAAASEAKTTDLILYNYPSFAGAFAALFAHLYHSRFNFPHLILPFSSIEPFRVEDLCINGLQKCYFLDFIGPKGFARELSRRTSCGVVGFDHRKPSLSKIQLDTSGHSIIYHVNIQKSSCIAVYEYFSVKLAQMGSDDLNGLQLLNPEDQDHLETVLNYIEDGDLHRWSLPETRAFSVGIREWRSKLNCLTNPRMFSQLMTMTAGDIIAKGNSYIKPRQLAANKLVDKSFKIRLGGGLYGECLCVRADGHSDIADESGKELSQKSAASGLRPIGAVVYMQRKNLKMCLRTTDSATDTAEVAKAYGGGGSPSSSSFIIRMDEYNKWLSPGKL